MHATDHTRALQSQIDEKGSALFTLLLANDKPRLGTYIALAKAIQDEGHLAVVARSPGIQPAESELVGYESVEFSSVPFEEIKRLRGVDLFFSPEMVADVAPPGAVTVGIPHSLPDSRLAKQRFAANAAHFIKGNPLVIRTFDYFIVAVRQKAREWTNDNYAFIRDVYPAAFLEGRRTYLDIVPGGYPKLDYSRCVLSSPSPGDCIVYCPTANGAVKGRVRQDGHAVLAALLESFPHHAVVFRPYPGAATHLAGRFKDNPRFVLDETMTGSEYQRRCCVAVTDSSSSAITFALATNRPLVFVNLGRGERASTQSQAASEPETNPFGFSVESTEAMVAAVRRGIDDRERWAAAIEAEATRNIYNPGTAAAYLASHLERFANRESHADWLSVARTPWEGEGADDQARHLERLRAWSGKDKPKSVRARTTRLYEEVARYFADSTPLRSSSEGG